MTCATDSAARLRVPTRADAHRSPLICFALKQGATNSCSCCHDVILCWNGKEGHETLSPIFPVQASLSQVPSWRKVGHQIHEAPSAPLQFVSLMKSPVCRCAERLIISRALSFDSRKPGDERPSALMFLQHKTANPWTQLAVNPICCIRRLLPITESIDKCFIGGGGRHLCFQKQLPAACPQIA